MGRDHSCEECGGGGMNDVGPCTCKPLTPVDREGLRRLAREASPEEWVLDDTGGTADAVIVHDDPDAPRGYRTYTEILVGRERDVRFAHAANPRTVIALLDELDEWDAYGELHTETRERCKANEQAMYDIAEERDALLALLSDCRGLIDYYAPDRKQGSDVDKVVGRIDQALGEKP